MLPVAFRGLVEGHHPFPVTFEGLCSGLVPTFPAPGKEPGLGPLGFAQALGVGDMAQDLAAAAVNSPRAECVIIDGGEHSIANKKQEASAAVSSWLATLAPWRVGV